VACGAAALAAMAFAALAATERAEEPATRPTSARALMAEGSDAYRRGQVDVAIRHWREVLPQGPAGRRIDARLNLGKAYQALGRYRQAALELETALSLAEQAEDPGRTLAAKNALGAVLTMTRQWQRAEAILVESLALAEGDEAGAARAAILNNLGNLYAAGGDYKKADRMYAEGLALARQAGATGEAGRLAVNSGISAAAAGRYDVAAARNGSALGVLERLRDGREKAYLLITAGRTDEKVLPHRPNQKRQLLRRAFDSYHRALKVARRVGDRRAESYALGRLGGLYEMQKRHAEALRLTREAAFLAQQLRAPELLYRWQWQAGRLLRAGGEIEAAAKSLRQAVATLKSVRQEMAGGLGNRSLLVGFREAVGGMYYDLADTQLRLADSQTDPQRARQLVVEARNAVETFKSAEMVDYFRDRCMGLARTKARTIEGIAPRTAVMYLIPLPDRTEILLSAASGLKRIKVPVGADRLVSEVRRFRRHLENRTLHRYRTSGRRLHRWLISPAESALAAEGVTTLVFVPDGALRTIPMAALHDGNSFLIERYAVAVTPGLTLMAPRPFDPGDQAALLCGISEPRRGFAPLRHVRGELDRIQKLMGGRRLIDDTFRLAQLEKEVSAKPPQVLHIASHGQFSGDPAKTFVLTHDGRLTLDEIEMLIRPSEFRGRPVELLSLSACQTAAGDDRAALGLAGVALKAGARSALATLWFVNDEATARLVSTFYEGLYRSPAISKAAALQQAQQSIMKDPRYRHPCYWAPYLLIGNWL